MIRQPRLRSGLPCRANRYMPTLHVLLEKENLDGARLEAQVAIVVDTLFASSTIVHALSSGADVVWPALDSDEALRIAGSLPGCICAGEYMMEALPGFASAAPLALAAEGLSGRSVVYCTTNGTVALRRAASAASLYVGSLLNGAALAAHVVRAHRDSPVIVVCAGSAGHFNLEDFYCAGHLVSHLIQGGEYEINDAAVAALLLSRGCDAQMALRSSRVGRILEQRSLGCEVDYAACRDILDVIVRMEEGRLLRVQS